MEVLLVQQGVLCKKEKYICVRKNITCQQASLVGQCGQSFDNISVVLPESSFRGGLWDLQLFNNQVDIFFGHGHFGQLLFSGDALSWLGSLFRAWKNDYSGLQVKWIFCNSSGSLNISVILRPKWLEFGLRAYFSNIFAHAKFQLPII